MILGYIADNIVMSEDANFLEQLKEAVKNKTAYLNTNELPKLLDQYRLLHTCVKNIYEALVKKALITPDPYKLEKKISDIKAPEEGPYAENERAMVIGARFSDYESMLDFICTYVKFSVESINIPTIKKLMEINNAFQWNNMTLNNARVNTRGLATLINEAKKNVPQITLSLINDSIAKSSEALDQIAKALRDLTDFQKESYKLEVRLNIFEHPTYNKTKAEESEDSQLSEIRRIFPAVMGKTPYYSDLINEIINEERGSNKQASQKAVLKKLAVVQEVNVRQKVKIDTKSILLGAMHTIATLAPTYTEVAEKLLNNKTVLSGKKKTFFEKIKDVIRQMLGKPDPAIIYNFIIADPKKETKSVKAVDINVFISNIEKKANFFGVLINKSSPEFKKLSSFQETEILEYLNKQVTENQEILTLLDAADEYFKNNVVSMDRSKIKGLKMDLVTIKNIIVKTVQKRGEYLSIIEEQEQMKKLGISDEM